MGFLFANKPYTVRIIGKYSFLFLCFSGFLNVLTAEHLHILEKGETLYSVSRKYRIPLPLILERNNINNAGKIFAGQKIYIPKTHTVKKGETLYSIARSYAVSVADITKANAIAAGHILKIGQRLIIPESSLATASTVPTKNKTPFRHDPHSNTQKNGAATLLWPVKVSSISYFSGKLYGVTINSYKDEPVRTITSGRVISKGLHRGYGTVVFIQSEEKYLYVYGGLKETNIITGQKIAFGQHIGSLAEDPLTGIPRLYFLVYKNNKPLDPMKAPRGQ